MEEAVLVETVATVNDFIVFLITIFLGIVFNESCIALLENLIFKIWIQFLRIMTRNKLVWMEYMLNCRSLFNLMTMPNLLSTCSLTKSNTAKNILKDKLLWTQNQSESKKTLSLPLLVYIICGIPSAILVLPWSKLSHLSYKDTLTHPNSSIQDVVLGHHWDEEVILQGSSKRSGFMAEIVVYSSLVRSVVAAVVAGMLAQQGVRCPLMSNYRHDEYVNNLDYNFLWYFLKQILKLIFKIWIHFLRIMTRNKLVWMEYILHYIHEEDNAQPSCCLKQ
ncbi:hypothetical protein ACJX0J_019164, partial [Zea mays]